MSRPWRLAGRWRDARFAMSMTPRIRRAALAPSSVWVGALSPTRFLVMGSTDLGTETTVDILPILHRWVAVCLLELGCQRDGDME